MPAESSSSPLPPDIRVRSLPYQDRLETRPPDQVDLVVIHCTELPDLAMAREYGERVLYPASGTGNSGHFYIDRDGSLHQYVATTRIAHHTHGFNPRSIGIELVNTGRYPHWLDSRHQAMEEAYTDAQLAGLSDLLGRLCLSHPSLRWIAGHEHLDTTRVTASDDPDIQVPRKRDPGPRFPWGQLLQATTLERLPCTVASPDHLRPL